MQTVTTLQLRAAFIAAIKAIVPTMEMLRSQRYSYVDKCPRTKDGRAVLPAAMRAFDLVFRDSKPDDLWVGGLGRSYSVKLAVAVSYPAIAPTDRDHVISADAVDLYKAFRKLTDPAVPGLSNVTPLGLRNAVETQHSFSIEHTFEVSHHQATV